MRAFLSTIFFLIAFSVCYAISIDDVIKLSKMKTSDDLIIDLIQKDGLDKPVTPSEVVYLKEQGVSERVIQYMLKVSNPEKEKLPPQEGESVSISDKFRAYYTRNKDGKLVKVITNLDEEGKRIGGEAPPAEPEEQQIASTKAYEQPREMRVVVEQEPDRRKQDYQEVYSEDYRDRYSRPSDYDYYEAPFYSTGIPLYGYYSYPYSYPSYFQFPFHTRFKQHRSMFFQQPTSFFVNKRFSRPRMQAPTPTPTVTRSVRGTSAGAKSFRR